MAEGIDNSPLKRGTIYISIVGACQTCNKRIDSLVEMKDFLKMMDAALEYNLVPIYCEEHKDVILSYWGLGETGGIKELRGGAY